MIPSQRHSLTCVLTYHLLQTLLKIPYAALIGGAVIKSLFFLVPTAALYNIIRLVMRFPEHAARTTANFIKSRMGVRQLLYVTRPSLFAQTSNSSFS